MGNRLGMVRFAKSICLLIAVLALCSMVACSDKSDGSDAAASSSASSSSASDSSWTSSAGGDERSSSAGTPVLDWTDNADRALVNERLSWMSQAFKPTNIKAVDLDSPYDLVSFAVQYTGVNNNDFIENGDFTSISSIGGGAGGVTNQRVSAEVLSAVTQDFFGKTPDYAKLDSQRRFEYVDGYVYFGITAPYGQIAAYSSVDSIEDLGEAEYKVAFSTITGDMPYEAHDAAFFAQDTDAMVAQLKGGQIYGSGEAVIRVKDGEEGKSVIIESFSFAEAGNAAPAPADAKSMDSGTESIGCDAFKLDVPSVVAGQIKQDWPQEFCLSASANSTPLFEIRCNELAPKRYGSEGKVKAYTLGTAVANGVSSQTEMRLFYIASSGSGAAHWNDQAATELAVEKLLGMTPDELMACISLRNASGEWVPANPVYLGGD